MPSERVPAGAKRPTDRKTKQPAPGTPAPAPKYLGWRAAFQELYGWEQDKVMQMIGMDASTPADQWPPMSMMCASATVWAQRADPSIPDDRWRTLHLTQIDVIRPADPADKSDPT